MFTTSPPYTPVTSTCFESLIIRSILDEGVKIGLGLDVPENKYMWNVPVKKGIWLRANLQIDFVNRNFVNFRDGRLGDLIVKQRPRAAAHFWFTILETV